MRLLTHLFMFFSFYCHTRKWLCTSQWGLFYLHLVVALFFGSGKKDTVIISCSFEFCKMFYLLGGLKEDGCSYIPCRATVQGFLNSLIKSYINCCRLHLGFRELDCFIPWCDILRELSTMLKHITEFHFSLDYNWPDNHWLPSLHLLYHLNYTWNCFNPRLFMPQHPHLPSMMLLVS